MIMLSAAAANLSYFGQEANWLLRSDPYLRHETSRFFEADGRRRGGTLAGPPRSFTFTRGNLERQGAPKRVLVVGAGLAGLSAAGRSRRHGS